MFQATEENRAEIRICNTAIPYGSADRGPRREIITVRGQSYFSRLSKYWPPIPISARRVCPPLPSQQRRGYTLAGRRGGWGSIFWKTREIGLPSYSNGLSTGVRNKTSRIRSTVLRNCCKPLDCCTAVPGSIPPPGTPPSENFSRKPSADDLLSAGRITSAKKI